MTVGMTRVRTRRLIAMTTAGVIALGLGGANLAAAGQPDPRGSGGRIHDAGDEAQELMESVDQFQEARTAPTGLVAPGAYANATAQLAALAPSATSWSQITNVRYNADDPRYRDPGASNSSGGAGDVSGRVQAVAADGRCVYAGGAMSGVSRSCDHGSTWTPIADALPTQSVGQLQVDPTGNLWLATGDGTTASSTYVGAGVYRLGSPQGGTFTPGDRVGGTELDSQVIRGMFIDRATSRVFVAASRGLYVHSMTTTSGAWQLLLAPCAQGMVGCGDVAASYRDIANDVVVQPGTNGKVVLANVAWRSGAAYNGFYLSTDGGASFAKVNPQGAINPKDVGNATMRYSADGSALYLMMESPAALLAGKASALAGVYVSRNGGAAAGPYNQIANSQVFAQSGSAERKQRIGGGYQPGVQAWYNQFLGVDPADPNHLYAGLEEVYETRNGGATWQTIGRYWDFGFACWSYLDSANTCDGNVTHADQHAIAFSPDAGTIYVGNDGGLYSRPTASSASAWTSWASSGELNFLQYYGVAVGRVPGSTSQMLVWGGLQDNGVSLLDPRNAAMVSPFGGDGGRQIADPNNGCRSVGEYVGLTLQLTLNCGVADGSPASDGAIIDIAPADPLPRFIAPFGIDGSDEGFWVAGGQYVWTNTRTWDSRSGADWTKAADSGAGHSITAIASRGRQVWAGWCGACNPGATFARGLLTNAGDGTYRQVATSANVPVRMITGVTPDPSDSKSSYVVFGGFSRNWVDGPGHDLAGAGHVFRVTVSGATNPDGTAAATWTDVSGNLPDVPSDDVLIVPGTNRVVLATDLGVLETTWTGAGSLTSGAPVWTRGSIPATVATQAVLGPDGKVYVSTFGRGIYRD